MPTFPGSSASKPYEDDSEEDETMPAFARSWAVVSAESGGCLSPATGCWEKCQPGNACMGEKRTAPTHPHEGPIPVFFLAATIMLYTSCAKKKSKRRISRQRGVYSFEGCWRGMLFRGALEGLYLRGMDDCLAIQLT